MNNTLRIKQRKVEECKPDPNNARTHSKLQIAQIADSISEFGFNNPILMHGDKVVAGHGRLEAALLLGMEKVPTISLDHLTDKQRRLYVLADNKIAENASWSEDLLRAEVEDLLSLTDVDIYLTGFAEHEIESLLNGDTSKDLDVYTRRIVAPIYEPSEDEPVLAELMERGKTDLMIEEIKAAKLDPEVEAFLIAAAERHTVFDFQKIADYYAHSEKKVRRLMERSALVIIDFEQAIENGFVRLATNLSKLANMDDDDA